MVNKNQTIAAVMPTRNQAEFLEAAVRSVYPQVDLLVAVDDASTDETFEMLMRLNGELDGLCVVYLKDRVRTHGAINRGIRHIKEKTWVQHHAMANPSEFDWLTWVSSDNTCEPGWRDGLLSAAGPTTGVVYSAYYRQRPNGSRAIFNRAYDPKKLINDENCFFGPSFIIRRDVWLEVGDHRGAISHDYDHWLRVEEVCWRRGLDIVHVPKPLCVYNAHAKRRTHTERDTYDATKWRLEAEVRRGIRRKPGE